MKIHTIQLNIEDLKGGTNHMDAAELGAYLSLLLCLYQAKSHTIPDNDARLARMARVSTRLWKRIRPVLEEKFAIKDGVWSHARVKSEAVKVQTLSQKNRANALKRYKSDLPTEDVSHYQKPANISNKEQIINKKDNTNVLSKKKRRVSLDELSLSHIQDWLTAKRVAGKYHNIDEHRLLEKFKDYCKSTKRGSQYKDFVAAFRNSFDWHDAPTKGKTYEQSDKSQRADAAVERAIEELELERRAESALEELEHERQADSLPSEAELRRLQ